MPPLVVFVTTSGIGGRISRLTKYTNKALIPVGDKYALARIIELYPVDTEFIITVGYLGNLVKEFIYLAYPTRKITFVDVDLYDGMGSSQVYSMLKAEPHLQRPFIFHCCDTITDTQPELSDNRIYVSKGYDTNTYASITISGEACEVNFKGTNNFDYIYVGIVSIVDYAIFWQTLRNNYNSTPDNSSMSDVLGIRGLTDTGRQLRYSVINNFYDTGNEHSYRQLCDTFSSAHSILAKPTESLCFFENTVIKFIHDKRQLQNFIERGHLLVPLSVTILDQTDNFIKMEFLNGGTLANNIYPLSIRDLLIWADEKLWLYPKTNPKFVNEIHKYYIAKTYERISQLDLEHEIHTVNGIYVGSIRNLLEKIPVDSLGADTKYYFHGDFTIDNVISTNDGFRLIDWRSDFNGDSMYGDIYYELAKLRHSIYLNHYILEKHRRFLRKNDKERLIYVDVKISHMLGRQADEIDKYMLKRGMNIEKLRIITSLLWINMAPLYDETLRDFLFYFGKLNLALALLN